MKATFRIGDLRTAIDRAMLAVERGRTNIPILSCLMLSVTRAGITVQGTNLDMMVTATAPVLSSEGGKACVNARGFAALLRALPRDQEASLTHQGERLVIDVPDGRFAFMALSAADWPGFTIGEETTRIDVPLPSLASAIARLTPFICSEETRYYLNGIHLHAHEGRVLAVATDGHRLGVVATEIDAAAFGDRKIIVPRQTIAALAKVMNRRDDKTIRLEFHADAAGILRTSFVLDGVRLDTRLIDGTYPEYRRVIPAAGGSTVEADVAPLLSTLRRLSAIWQFADHRGGRIQVPAEGQASIASGHSENGAILVAPIRRVSGDGDVEIRVNLAYLRHCLQSAGGTKVRMQVTDPGSPILFSAEDGSTFVLMPLRVIETMFTALPDGAGLARAA